MTDITNAEKVLDDLVSDTNEYGYTKSSDTERIEEAKQALATALIAGLETEYKPTLGIKTDIPSVVITRNQHFNKGIDKAIQIIKDYFGVKP